MAEIKKLLDGFRVFKATTFDKQKDIIKHLIIQEHKPSTMVISSCDIKISPAEIFSVNPGEFFTIFNIGGLIPKYKTEGISGIISALEYGVINLGVDTIMVLSNTKNISSKMIMSDDFENNKNTISQAMKTWLSIASEAREAVLKQMSQSTKEEQEMAFEKEAVVISVRNLLTYPYIQERINKNTLKILGWQFDVESGEIRALNLASGSFDTID
jgi:carbonic anhydrase